MRVSTSSFLPILCSHSVIINEYTFRCSSSRKLHFKVFTVHYKILSINILLPNQIVAILNLMLNILKRMLKKISASNTSGKRPVSEWMRSALQVKNPLVYCGISELFGTFMMQVSANIFHSFKWQFWRWYYSQTY